MTGAANTWAIVPVKPFAEAKSRLAPSLSEAERRDLARRLLRHALDAIVEAGRSDRVLVVSRDSAALELARSLGLEGLIEEGSDLNQALSLAAARAEAGGAAAILVVAADLPLLAAADIEAMLEGSMSPVLRIAPDRWRSGTNSLFLSPPGLVPFAFGADSFAQHSAAAQAAGGQLNLVERGGLAFDLDSPQDLDDLPAISRELGLEPLIGHPAQP